MIAAFAAQSANAQEVEAVEPNRGGMPSYEARDPQVALERLHPAEGYEVSLFATEKDFPLGNPVALNFDAKGRMWVATMPTYPQRLPDQEPVDKIIILEDTDKDGRADKHTVFIDNLHLPTGFELGDGGVYIAAQPNLIFAKDTDGDDVADERHIILHGFGTEDSHHSISAFTWGPDGGLYFQEGTFHHSQVETPYGPVRLVDAGLFRYKPLLHWIEVFVSYPFANPWGHVFDRWGQNFIADASGGSNYVGLPITVNKIYPDKTRGMKVFTSVVRPTAGCEIVSSRHFPD
ncbi:MAG: PVC-type heme-binding CxxCH protein [Candidatus Hydrogenedentales bacterium]